MPKLKIVHPFTKDADSPVRHRCLQSQPSDVATRDANSFLIPGLPRALQANCNLEVKAQPERIAEHSASGDGDCLVEEHVFRQHTATRNRITNIVAQQVNAGNHHFSSHGRSTTSNAHVDRCWRCSCR